MDNRNARCTGTGDMNISEPSIKKKDTVLKAAAYIFSIGLSLLTTYPFILMIIGQFREPEGPGFDTAARTWESIVRYWKEFVLFFDSGSFTGFRNSVIVSVLGTVFCMYVSSLTAYAITAYEWKLREAFDNMILIVVMLPSTVATVGYYQLVYKFHLINMLSMLILPAIASPLTVLFMRLYLKATFSRAMVESARLDGAGEFRIFNQIILPLLKPAIATQAIFCFVTSWHNDFVPRIILIDGAKKTLPLVSGGNSLLLSFLPPILVYAFLSKHIVEGVALGGEKI